MPYIEATGAQVLTALADVGYGIGIEKNYVSWTSVLLNTINFAIALAAITLPPEAFGLLFLYLCLGFYVTRKHKHEWYFLFGSKTYGSLMLVLALNQFGYMNWLDKWLNEFNEIVAAWIGLAIMVHAIGEQYKKRFSPYHY